MSDESAQTQEGHNRIPWSRRQPKQAAALYVLAYLLVALVGGAVVAQMSSLLAIGVAVILLIRRSWVPRVVQIALIVGGAEWVRTTVILASGREAAGQSWIRLAAILGAVALFTMCSGLVFRLPRLRERYGA